MIVAQVVTWLRCRSTKERGASLVEYALLLALIAVVCIVSVASLGGSLNDSYTNSGSSIFPP